MPLPKISQPLFELKLPSTGKAIRYRPFTVREEKLLMMAQESGERSDIINTYKQLINNCCIDPVDVDKLASFDIEYFFVCLRSKSVSNISKVLVKDEDGEQYEVEINLDKIQVAKNQELTNNIKLTDNIGVILRYPTFSAISKLGQATDGVETTMTVLRMCIEQIYEGEEVHDVSNYTAQEVNDFILSLNKNQIEEIQKFFENMPKIVYDAKYVNKNGDLKEVRIEGLENFF